MKPKYKYPNIAAEMAKVGMTQKDLAKELGLSAPNVHYRLYGEVEWKVKECIIVCNLLNADFRYLFESV